jgi:RNA polymerase sigma-54 factor
MRAGGSLNAIKQKLLITPELRQTIAILTMATADLIRYIENAVLENPMLEIIEDADTVEDGPRAEREQFTLEWCTMLAECGQIDGSFDGSDGAWAQAEDPLQDCAGHCLAQAPTLREHLGLQLHFARSGARIRKIARHLIGNIDDRGYLCEENQNAGQAYSCTAQDLEQAIRLIQSFDPPGVGGRNLKECLLLQLERRGLRNALMERLVSSFIKDPTGGSLSGIARSLGFAAEVLTARCDLIRSLNSDPGSSFSHPGEPRYIIPDVVVEQAGDKLQVLVNDLSVPRLMVNRTYQVLLTERGACDLHDARFLEDKLRAAVRLIRSVEQRRSTLHRVAQLIIESQSEFLNKGMDHLRPLKLESIAQVVGLHRSTVSRTIANKYVETPRGVFELKAFCGGYGQPHRLNTGMKNAECMRPH